MACSLQTDNLGGLIDTMAPTRGLDAHIQQVQAGEQLAHVGCVGLVHRDVTSHDILHSSSKGAQGCYWSNGVLVNLL